MGGMMTSFTREVTMVPKAAPMIRPTAMSTTLPRMANSRNSFNMIPPQNLATSATDVIVSVVSNPSTGWLA